MRKHHFILLILLCCTACTSEKEQKSEVSKAEKTLKNKFDKTKWSIKKGKDYPFRDQMLDEVVDDDKIRKLNYGELIELLGEPDRMNEGHLYYIIDQTRIGSWPLKTKTMVIKLSDDNKVEWIKIHGD